MLLPSNIYHIYNHGNSEDLLFLEDRNYPFFLEKYEKHINPIAETIAWCLMPNHFHLMIRIKSVEELMALKLFKLDRQGYRPQNIDDSNSKNNTFNQNSSNPDRQGYRPQNIDDLNSKNNTFNQDLPNPDRQGYPHLNIDDSNSKNNTFNQDLPNLDGGWITKKISQQFSNLFNSYTKAFNKTYGRRGSLFLKNFKRKEADNLNYQRTLVHYIHANPVKHKFVKDCGEWKWSSYSIFEKDSKHWMESLFGDEESYRSSHQEFVQNLFKKNLPPAP